MRAPRFTVYRVFMAGRSSTPSQLDGGPMGAGYDKRTAQLVAKSWRQRYPSEKIYVRGARK